MPDKSGDHMNNAELTPIQSSARLESIDVLRGVAVLGILLMNIRLFGMPFAAYFNPMAYGDISGINQWLFWLTSLFADQKFMTIFSMLFGAGIVLMGERAEASGRSPAWLLYKRNTWLLVLGAMHAYLLWYGDILVVYALCGFFVILFRRRSATTQFIIGLLMLAIGSALSFMAGLSLENWPPDQLEEAISDWAPGAALIAEEVAAYQGAWIDQQAHRVPHSFEFHTLVFLYWGFWRAGGLMLIGMAAYRWGLFSASLDPSRYRRLALIGLLIGLPIVAWGLFKNEADGWIFETGFFLNYQYNYWGSLPVSMAYVGLVMLWCQGARLARLRARMSAVGRMAFSNYIAQSVICTLIFYGHGLGLFGQMQRWQMFLVVIAVWTVLLLVSPWWLARFRFGPLEWLWRSLTYLKLQPMRR
jgi:uncharacterized protein